MSLPDQFCKSLDALHVQHGQLVRDAFRAGQEHQDASRELSVELDRCRRELADKKQRVDAAEREKLQSQGALAYAEQRCATLQRDIDTVRGAHATQAQQIVRMQNELDAAIRASSIPALQGATGESWAKELLLSAFGGAWAFESTSKLASHTDGILTWTETGMRFLVEVKDKKVVDKGDIEKFYLDLRTRAAETPTDHAFAGALFLSRNAMAERSDTVDTYGGMPVEWLACSGSDCANDERALVCRTVWRLVARAHKQTASSAQKSDINHKKDKEEEESKDRNLRHLVRQTSGSIRTITEVYVLLRDIVCRHSRRWGELDEESGGHGLSAFASVVKENQVLNPAVSFDELQDGIRGVASAFKGIPSGRSVRTARENMDACSSSSSTTTTNVKRAKH